MLVFCEYQNGCLAHAIDFKQGRYLCAAHYEEIFGEPSPNLALTQGRTGFSKEELAQIYFERLRSQISPEEQRDLEMVDQVLDYEQSFRLRQPPPQKVWYNQD